MIKKIFHFICKVFTLVFLTWTFLMILLGLFLDSQDFSNTTVRYIFLFLPMLTTPILYKYFHSLKKEWSQEKELETIRLKNKVKTHYTALSHNMRKALKRDDYAKITANLQRQVIEDFLGSVGYQKHLLTKKEAKALVAKELGTHL